MVILNTTQPLVHLLAAGFRVDVAGHGREVVLVQLLGTAGVWQEQVE